MTQQPENQLSSRELAELIIDALFQASIVKQDHVARAVQIVVEELDARKAVGDY